MNTNATYSTRRFMTGLMDWSGKMIRDQNTFPRNKQSKGYNASFDIGEGNHIQALSDKNQIDRTPIFLDYKLFRCQYCGKKKPRKGSKMVQGFKKCQDCAAK